MLLRPVGVQEVLETEPEEGGGRLQVTWMRLRGARWHSAGLAATWCRAKPRHAWAVGRSVTTLPAPSVGRLYALENTLKDGLRTSLSMVG